MRRFRSSTATSIAPALSHAAALGLPTKIIERQNFATRHAHDAAIEQAIKAAAADFVFLAGYLAILGAEFTTIFAGRLINIHPSLLPEFKGLNTHQRAIDANAARHGATVHLVTAALDDGPIILQAELSMSPHDNAEKLAARVLLLEHQLYPFVLKSLCVGQLTLAADMVTWHHQELPTQTVPPSAAAASFCRGGALARCSQALTGSQTAVCRFVATICLLICGVISAKKKQ